MPSPAGGATSIGAAAVGVVGEAGGDAPPLGDELLEEDEALLEAEDGLLEWLEVDDELLEGAGSP